MEYKNYKVTYTSHWKWETPEKSKTSSKVLPAINAREAKNFLRFTLDHRVVVTSISARLVGKKGN